ncbi:MAG: tetratricopeptide repeat protein [Acidobacteriota bacterium]|nr:tetratricopeptide repeat protein [Acidobacteriota bacterium]
MKGFDKKRLILAGCLAAVAGGALFLFRAVSRSESQPAPKAAAAVKNNPDHELKELGVQLQQKPGHVPVLMRMAQIEREQGKMPDAIKHLREAAASEPSNTDVLVELGRVLYETGARGEARQITERAVTINPKSVDALYNLGAIYANSGDPARARAYWQQAAVADPSSESGKRAKDGIAQLGTPAPAASAAVHHP